MQAFQSLLELLGMLVTDPRTGILMALLMLASVWDFRYYRIPNWLTASGIVFALIYNTVVASSPASGLLWSAAGMLVGMLLTMPLYLLKTMGAGDVKLMAMVGAFLGLPAILYAVVFTFIAGGIAALGFALCKGALGRMLNNVKNIVQVMVLSAIGGIKPDVSTEAGASVGKLPYGISISIGSIGFMVTRQLGYV